MKKLMLSVLLTVFAAAGMAVEAPVVSLKAQAEGILVDVFGPRLKLNDARLMANQQLVEAVLNDGSSMYLTPDLKFLFVQGRLYELTEAGPVDVVEVRMPPKRLQAMATVKDEDTVKFLAKGEEKAVINVFTDIECYFCQKLHKEVPRLNELGITVRYLAFPRAGITDSTGHKTESYLKINSVWCSKDRTGDMTRLKAAQSDLAKLRQSSESGFTFFGNRDLDKVQQVLLDAMAKGNCSSPVEKQLDLGHSIGVSGTPAIITQDGGLLPGYMPADDLARRIGVL